MSQIRTYSGKMVSLSNPRPEEIDIADIAHALARLCRYTGHVEGFYSVAQHSVLVSQSVEKTMKGRVGAIELTKISMYALLHDASEAYLGDVNRPLKQLLRTQDATYDLLEARMTSVVMAALGLDGMTMPKIVKEHDDAIIDDEKRTVKPGGDSIPVNLYENIDPETYEEAEFGFLARFEELSWQLSEYARN